MTKRLSRCLGEKTTRGKTPPTVIIEAADAFIAKLNHRKFRPEEVIEADRKHPQLIP